MSTFYDVEDEETLEESKSDDAVVKTFKIIIIGDSNVGKTCLAYRFCTGKFPERTETTIGVDFWEKSLEIGGECIKFQIWDTAGQERFRKSMVCHYYRNVSAVVFMYDITRRETFEALTTWLYEYGHHGYGVDVPKILIGNKCDLGYERTVSSNVARKFADFHNMPLWEISTKNDEELQTIESIFLTLAHKLLKHKPLMDRKRTRIRNDGANEIEKKKGSHRLKRSSSKPIKLKHQSSKEQMQCCQ